ncbi:dipeptidyl aminopeptidase/acylaminoacyl peptidase [Algoriphagus sp. 4150]|uniref:alpha/beta hydrolase family protein n=1 Tax=Algoriphagus sp. 4150 TaxID=2817756 RepID=UPI0028652B37|nr:prolyl oligopeptidase family serine peptidase [Algoriphagus sp. 4150]MDR7132033.1 dipeptidyl aminopeptidase/acylaminoacyl peptidase [Algoriphagus sp. 4150]
MKRLFTFFWLFCLICNLAIAQDEAAKPMTWKDIPTWKYMNSSSFKISPDGQWVAYGMIALEADGEVILQKVSEPDSTKTFKIGFTNFPSIEFSEDSKWIAFKEHPTFKEKEANKKSKGKPLHDKVTLIKLGSDDKDDKKTFENVSNFSFNGKAATHFVVNLTKDGSGDAKGSDLLIYHLNTDKAQNIGNVAEFSFNKSGNYLAYTVEAANQSGNGIYLMNLTNNSTSVLDSDKATYKSINWTEKGDAFAALKMVKDKKYKQDQGKLVGVKNLTSPQVTVYDPIKDSVGFSKEYTISPNRRPVWSEDLTRLFYGIHPLVLAKKEDEKKELDKDSVALAESEAMKKIMADTSLNSIADLKKALSKLDSGKVSPKDKDTDKPDMTIWHWNDSRLQSRQQILENQDKNYSFYAMYDVAAGKHTQLQDSTMRDLNILDKEKYAIGSDNQAYELQSNLDGQNYRDFYIIDLKTGEKKDLFSNFYLPGYSSYPRSSPDGTKLIYGYDGDYYSYDIASGEEMNLTASLPVTFVNVDDDHNVKKPLQGALGWSSDSQYVLLNDGWDIWQVTVSGKAKAINLTQNGRSEKIKYQYRFALDRDEKGINLSKPLYLRAYGEWTKKSGIAVINSSKKGLEAGAKLVVWEDAGIGSLKKAENAEVYFFTQEKFNEPDQIYVADATLSSPTKITNNAPDAGKYAWSSGTRLVDYVSDKGDTLQGALFLPANYVDGDKYPTVVYYYEKLSQTRHSWTNPGYSGTGWNPNVYTSNGFAVFIPDIVYTMDDPGMSAVWCVIPGVKAAIETGVIDEDNIGIHGHSWGGYQTSFLITQTDMFKAAAAGAPLTNMISMYDLIYWNSGGGNMSIFEASQGRFTGGPWENWAAYERNSPVYHVKNVTTPLLMLHNDKDGAVDFTQGIEYYSALRRLKKPVILVQYKGENHGLGKLENRKDYSVRMMEFFDHHLKGAEAPDWMSKGIDKIDLEEHLEKRAF